MSTKVPLNRVVIHPQLLGYFQCPVPFVLKYGARKHNVSANSDLIADVTSLERKQILPWMSVSVNLMTSYCT